MRDDVAPVLERDGGALGVVDPAANEAVGHVRGLHQRHLHQDVEDPVRKEAPVERPEAGDHQARSL